MNPSEVGGDYFVWKIKFRSIYKKVSIFMITGCVNIHCTLFSRVKVERVL